jgi:hypothetical protein
MFIDVVAYDDIQRTLLERKGHGIPDQKMHPG